MENTETAPLLGPAGRSMYHRSASDNVQLLPIAQPSSAMASPAIDDLSTSQSQDRFSEDSLRRRASSRSSGAGDDFFNIEVCVWVVELEREEVAMEQGMAVPYHARCSRHTSMYVCLYMREGTYCVGHVQT